MELDLEGLVGRRRSRHFQPEESNAEGQMVTFHVLQ